MESKLAQIFKASRRQPGIPMDRKLAARIPELFERLRQFQCAILAHVVSIFASDYIERGRVGVLHRYISALPAELLKTNPELLLANGNVLLRWGGRGRRSPRTRRRVRPFRRKAIQAASVAH